MDSTGGPGSAPPLSPAGAPRSSPDAALQALLQDRRSCRAFRPDPVPRETIARILELARRTASWSNCQPWHAHVACGEGTERLRAALVAHFEAGGASEPDFPFPREYRDVYLQRRRECGFQLYDAVGVARGDRPAYHRQHRENFRLFGAPHVAVISSDEALGTYGAVDCGGYVSNFMLAAQALGVASIAQAALAMYAPLLRELLGIGADRRIVCAISFGYADPSHPANGYRTRRAPLEETTTWVDA